MNAVTREMRAHTDAATVTFVLDGREVTALASDTLIEIADREGVAIPRLCYKPGMDAVGNCRSCMVEIKGERVLAAACCRSPTAGMQVTTGNERVLIIEDEPIIALDLETLVSELGHKVVAVAATRDEAALRTRGGAGNDRYGSVGAVAGR